MKNILLLLCFILASCTPKDMLSNGDPWTGLFETHETVQLANYQMKLIAAGPSDQDKAEAIALHYICFRKMKIPQVRKLIVGSVQDFLAMANHNPEIEPLLSRHPLKATDIRFNISYGKDNGQLQEPPYVAYAYLLDGTITYCYHDEMFGHFVEEEDVEESYNTALKLVLEEKAE